MKTVGCMIITIINIMICTEAVICFWRFESILCCQSYSAWNDWTQWSEKESCFLCDLHCASSWLIKKKNPPVLKWKNIAKQNKNPNFLWWKNYWARNLLWVKSCFFFFSRYSPLIMILTMKWLGTGPDWWLLVCQWWWRGDRWCCRSDCQSWSELLILAGSHLSWCLGDRWLSLSAMKRARQRV